MANGRRTGKTQRQRNVIFPKNNPKADNSNMSTKSKKPKPKPRIVVNSHLDKEKESNMGLEQVNWGTLKKMKVMCVNRFGTGPELNSALNRAFFLTHMDYCILKDFLNLQFLNMLLQDEEGKAVYLHEWVYHFIIHYWTTTKYVLPNEAGPIKAKLQKLKAKAKLVILKTEVPLLLQIFGKYYRATPLSAGHNLGSIMLLFETLSRSEDTGDFHPDEKLRILYTGNARVGVADLKGMKPLHHQDGSMKHIHQLYMDTTYVCKDIKELPDRIGPLLSLITFLMMEVERDKTLSYAFRTDFKISALDFFESLGSLTSENLHVPPNLGRFLKLIPGFNAYTKTMDEFATMAAYHYECDDWDAKKDVKSACSKKGNAYCGCEGMEKKVTMVTLGCQVPNADPNQMDEPNIEDIEYWNENDGHAYQYLDGKNGKQCFRGIFPTHLSRYEAARMVNYLEVEIKDVLPLYIPNKMVLKDVNTLLDETCQIEHVDLEPLELKDEYPCNKFDFTKIKPEK